jgi:hypothetical protein
MVALTKPITVRQEATKRVVDKTEKKLLPAVTYEISGQKQHQPQSFPQNI